MAVPRTEGEAIAQRLLTEPAVTALVGTRIYPSKPTQDPTEKYVVYYRTGGGDGRRLAGRHGLQNYAVRVEATAGTQAEAEAILAAVRERLAPVGDRWVDKTNGVHGCSTVGDADEQTLEDGRQVSGQTYSIWFKAQT